MAREFNIGGDNTMFVGEDKVFEYENLDDNNIPVDMATWTILMDVRKTDNAASPALLSKTMTVTGAYNPIRADNVQRARAVVSDDEMNVFGGRVYRYSIKRTDDGSETVLAFGNFTPQLVTAR